MTGVDMLLLQKRFNKDGYATERFRYRSTSCSPVENSHRLAGMLDSTTADSIHFICHSLGGLILRHYLNLYPSAKPGRVVMLGTPNKTCQAAKTLSGWPGGSFLLGKSTCQGLLGPLPEWNAKQELGIIAGDMHLGLGRLIPGIPRPGDGTVSVDETRLEGMRDHITIHASHGGLLISRKAFAQARHFIRHGRFMRV